VNDAAITRQPTRSQTWRVITSSLPSPAEASLVTGSALLTILSFPNFDLWFLAWISLVPLLIVVARAASLRKALAAGWLWGAVFFYGTCWWLTYPMIHFAGISAWLAYPLLLLPVILAAVFPALFAGILARIIERFGNFALILAAPIWVSTELLRYAVTGQLWNALGYSQAFHPWMIQTARWGGVYAISFALLLFSSAMALLLIRRDLRSILLSTMIIAAIISCMTLAVVRAANVRAQQDEGRTVAGHAVAVQPNVPMDGSESQAEMDALLQRHLALSVEGLRDTPDDVGNLVLIIWPESPMNFTYSRDPKLQQTIATFVRNHSGRSPVYVLLNSLEPAKGGGAQNSAILVNEKGEMSARYDKIRLMPFGEYVPLPHWLPGASSVRGLVGEFTPGSSYTLMPLGALRAGVFICIEAAHPAIPRMFAREGADVLINISNDGYLGPTAVMRQHLSNAIFRAVENDRPLVRVTNAGLTAMIGPDGSVLEQTEGFQQAVRSWWIIKPGVSYSTFYSRHGDWFVYGCALMSLGFISASFTRRRVSEARALGRAAD
jgi:apolipoprotein N-acyltransferase